MRFHPYSGWLETWQESTSWPFRLPTLVPGSVRPRAPVVAWYSTHRHDAEGADEPYVFCYLFHHVVGLEPGQTALGLPEAEDVRVFALTLSDDRIGDTRSAAVEAD